MCIGIPMQVVEQHGESARCLYRGQESLVDTMLVGPQPVGTWLLVFLDTAREVLSDKKPGKSPMRWKPCGWRCTEIIE